MKNSWSQLIAVLLGRLRADGHLSPGGVAAVVVALMLLQATLPVAAAALMGELADQLLQVRTQDGLWRLVVGWGAVMLAAVSVTAIFGYAVDQFGRRLRGHLTALVLEHAATLDLASLEEPATRDVLFRAEHDASTRVPSIVTSFITTASAFASAVVVFVALVAMVPMVALLLLAPLPLLWFVIRDWKRIDGWRRERSRVNRRHRYMSNLLTDARSAAELRAFSVGATLVTWTSELFEQVLEFDTLAARWTCRVDLLVNGAFVFMLTAAAAYATWQSALGALSVGSVVTVIQLLQRAHTAANGLHRGAAQFVSHRSDLHALQTFLSLEPTLKTPHPVPGPRSLSTAVRLENVSFKYQGAAANVIHHVDVSIPAGASVALVGSNGSGKSTLLRLMARLYDPNAGRILWDGTDIRDFDPVALRRQIAFGFQNAIRYQLPVRQVIELGANRAVTPDDIVSAAALSGADAMIKRLPDGYETLLGDSRHGGRELSAGQWQSLSLARTLIRDAPLVLLDEPNENLDPDAEREVFERLRSMMDGRTSVLVSHRFSAARGADLILVLDDGLIVERGTHQQLMADGGVYAHLFNQQASAYQ